MKASERGGVMQGVSWRRYHGGVIVEEVALRRGWGSMGDPSRQHGRPILGICRGTIQISPTDLHINTSTDLHINTLLKGPEHNLKAPFRQLIFEHSSQRFGEPSHRVSYMAQLRTAHF